MTMLLTVIALSVAYGMFARRYKRHVLNVHACSRPAFVMHLHPRCDRSVYLFPRDTMRK